MKRVKKTFLIGTVFLFCAAIPAYAMAPTPTSPYTPVLAKDLVAEADVDECFNGVGEPYKPGPNCSSSDIPKKNQSYLWGMTKSGENIWFGTGANVACLTQAYRAYTTDKDVNGFQNQLWACEFRDGQYLNSELSQYNVPDEFNDFRPPEIYTYNMATETLSQITDRIDDEEAKAKLHWTFGLRSAGSVGNLVFLAGPIALNPGINMFVFNGVTGDFVGAQSFPQYQNIRKWLTLNDVLYTTVSDETGGGKVLRWTGSESNPFSFEEVGVLDSSGTEIVEHEGRIFVGTWPNRQSENPQMAGIFMSPEVPQGGLLPAHSNSWTKVWEASEYEPDPVNASIYGCGPMASFDGYLYWGTMHVAANIALYFGNYFDLSIAEWPLAIANSWRATAIFRGKNFTSNKQVDLLYGEYTMPVYHDLYPVGIWTIERNKMGQVPRYGTSGFGNPYNNYTWTMAVYNDELYVGTMDFSYTFLDVQGLKREFGAMIDVPALLNLMPSISTYEYGGDLWRFPSSNEAAVRVTRNGMGNYGNYGFRTVVVDETYGMFLGTANPTNVLVDDYGQSLSGWDLYHLHWE